MGSSESVGSAGSSESVGRVSISKSVGGVSGLFRWSCQSNIKSWSNRIIDSTIMIDSTNRIDSTDILIWSSHLI